MLVLFQFKWRNKNTTMEKNLFDRIALSLVPVLVHSFKTLRCNLLKMLLVLCGTNLKKKLFEKYKKMWERERKDEKEKKKKKARKRSKIKTHCCCCGRSDCKRYILRRKEAVTVTPVRTGCLNSSTLSDYGISSSSFCVLFLWSKNWPLSKVKSEKEKTNINRNA